MRNETSARVTWAKARTLSRGDDARALEYVQFWAHVGYDPTWDEIKAALLANPLPKNMVN